VWPPRRLKDNTLRLWDPRIADSAAASTAAPGGGEGGVGGGSSSGFRSSSASGACLATLHWHKADVTGCAWNPVSMAYWLATGFPVVMIEHARFTPSRACVQGNSAYRF
jgi:hypothetical protein